MITVRQIDAGLALLGISRSDLAIALGINKSTLNAYFTGQSSIPSSRLAEIQKWLENAGILFTEDEGLKLNKADIIHYEGQQGFISFMTDVMESAKRSQNFEMCISNVDENDWENNLPKEFAEHYREQMVKVKGLKSRVLVKQGDDFHTAKGFTEYRAVPPSLFSEDACFYAYGEKLGLITFHNKSVQILVLNNKQFTTSFKVMFNAIWNNHEVIQ